MWISLDKYYDSLKQIRDIPSGSVSMLLHLRGGAFLLPGSNVQRAISFVMLLSLTDTIVSIDPQLAGKNPLLWYLFP